MKEITARTGLTDRAVRLYIENGLVSPQVEKNYAGRRTIDFSEADLQTLRQIALLRKAGFSLEQIRQVEQGPEEARQAADALLRLKREEAELDQKVIAALSSLPEDAALSLPTLATALEPAFSAAPVPESDLHMTVPERIIRIVVFLYAGFGIAWALFWPTSNVYSLLFEIRYPKLNSERVLAALPLSLCAVGCTVFSVFASVTLIRRYRRGWRSAARRRRRTLISCLLAVLILVSNTLVFLCVMFTMFAPFTVSETTDPEDYLLTDDWVRSSYGEIYRVFPPEIPFVAGDVRYYYHYEQSSFDVFAQWRYSLDRRPYYYHSPQEDYEEEKARLLVLPGLVRTEQRGAWTCCWLIESDRACVSQEWQFFAYRDDLCAVRYYYGVCGDMDLPLFLTDEMDWD